MQYFLTLEKELQFMSKYNLTSEEMLIIKLIFLAKENHSEYMREYIEECAHDDIIETLHSIQNKGFIPKSFSIEKGKTSVFDIELNKTFTHSFIRHSYSMGMDLFTHYPSTLFINGKQFSLKNITKLFKSLEDFSYAYGKNIGFNEELHNEIIDLVEWAKENNIINYGICEFVASMKWLELKNAKENGDGTFKTSELL